MARSMMSKIVPMIGLMAVVAIMSSYAVGILSANQENVNVTGTAYEETYNSSTKIQATTLTFFPYVDVFIVIGILLTAIGYMVWRVKRV